MSDYFAFGPVFQEMAFIDYIFLFILSNFKRRNNLNMDLWFGRRC